MTDLTQSVQQEARQVYMVLSPRALPYARLALESLFRNADEELNVHLITDTPADAATLREAVDSLSVPSRHPYKVTAQDELLDLEATRLAKYANIRAFRGGHPCWRKITDPSLLSQPGRELVLLDPDVYFPHPFRFEATPKSGLLLMWQKPNCLLPHSVVERAIDSGVALARHVDIGVSHWRAGGDLDWLNWLIGVLGGSNLPHAMHVEAIVWAALAMREGGGYLDPALWVCWHRTQRNRLLRKLHVSGEFILRSEPWESLLCFHAGGEAKWWLSSLGCGSQPGRAKGSTTPLSPFIPMSPQSYRREQAGKRMLRTLGYYRLLGAS